MVVRVNGFIKKGMKIMEKEYEIRNLTSEDVFPMSQIISKIGVDELASCFKDKDIQKIMEEAKDKEVVDIPQAVGVQVVMKLAQVVLKNLPSCKKDLYEFLASLTGKTTDEIASLPMGTFFQLLLDVIGKEDFKDFMQVVSKLFG